MAEQRLIDANNLGVGKANPDAFERKDYAYGWNSALQAVTDTSPTIDPETLPIVRQLREELAKVTAERDAAVEQLRGYCFACKHYTPYHNDGLCATCKHERACFKPWDAVDRWQWRGPQKKG
jgi:hypothetical protein